MTTQLGSAQLNQAPVDLETELSKEYETPAPQGFTSFNALKDRIRQHYELCSDYYYSLWGEHIHHGYYLSPSDTKEKAQVQLIELLLKSSSLSTGSAVLDVGCGIGGTSRYLAKNHNCTVTGVTISGRQVEIARRLTVEEAGTGQQEVAPTDFVPLDKGKVRFIELDAEKMGEYFSSPPNNATFDCMWISEAMSHLPDKELFFRNAHKLLNARGVLVVADWFKAEGLTDAQMEADIKPIEDGMLLPPLCSIADYTAYAKKADLSVFQEPLDISENVSKTWDVSWSLVQSPSLWALALTQGRDAIAFLQAFRAMRRGFANGSFRYAVMVFQK